MMHAIPKLFPSYHEIRLLGHSPLPNFPSYSTPKPVLRAYAALSHDSCSLTNLPLT